MIILIGLTVLLIIGILINKYGNYYSWEDVGFGLSLFSGLALILALLCWPLSYYSTKAEILRFKETQATYDRIRAKHSLIESIELAAIQIDIAKSNRWLAGEKYWNNTIFDIFIPDEVEQLKPIE